MKTARMGDTATAAIIGRFQVDDLHEAHQKLFERVLGYHRRVLVLIGVSRILGTRNDPLDYITRANMISAAYPRVTCLPLPDVPGNDEAWSQQLDTLVRTISPIGKVTLYGGRDSFTRHYTGSHHAVELDAISSPDSGTSIREQVGRQVLVEPGERRGVIYLAENMYPRVNQVVDIALLRTNEGQRELLLGQRAEDQGTGGNWRFPGGFVDPSDVSLEAAARRELGEETRADVEELEYVTSMSIVDGRMKGGDIIMTALFMGKLAFGALRAGDDIARISWHALNQLNPNIVYPNHVPLLGFLRGHLDKRAERE